MKTGLTLGKYAPFHKGHEYVIETMMSENDAGIVIIYNSNITNIPLPVRAGWIRTLFPQVRVIEAWDGPVDGSGSDYEKAEEVFITGLLRDAGIEWVDAFYCSEYYGAHMTEALTEFNRGKHAFDTPDISNCADRRVDEARVVVPVSGSVIREDPFRYRSFISDVVYRDLIVKVVFVGAMSTGKSTITEALARRYHTAFAREYGRDYWTQHHVDRRIRFEAFDEIATGHLQIEEEALKRANRYLFVDTNAITTYMYALDYHGSAPPLLTRLALENASRYDLFFLCEDDIPYDDTWDRSGDAKRQVFQKQIIADLEMRRIPYIPLRGSLEERMAKVEAILKTYEPYRNYYGKKAEI